MLRRALEVLSAFGISAVALGAAAGLTVTASAAPEADGHVYVNDNTSGTNTIAAFRRNADGSLTPLPGSPFGAGGQGTGTIVGSQGALQAADGGRYLLAVDAGSSQISVLRVRRDGSLRPVEGSPVSSGGVEPVSIAVHGSLVYVANEGDKTTGAGSNYTGFRLNRGGHLTRSRARLSPFQQLRIRATSFSTRPARTWSGSRSEPLTRAPSRSTRFSSVRMA